MGAKQVADAVDEFVEVITASDWMGPLGPLEHFTCVEADAFVKIIRATGETRLADQLLAAHIATDEPGDLHKP